MAASARAYTQPYKEAVEERMERLPEELGDLDDDDDNDDDYDYDAEQKKREAAKLGHPRCISYSTRVITLTLIDDNIIGTSVSGAVVFRIRCLGRAMNARKLKEEVINALGGEAEGCELTFLSQEAQTPLANDDEFIASSSPVVMKLVRKSATVFVCRKSPKKYLEPCLGEGCVRWDKAAFGPIIQGLQEHRDFVTQKEGMCWHVYSKEGVSMANCESDAPVVAVGIFPQPPLWTLPPNSRKWGGDRCDVWSASLDIPIVKEQLDIHALRTNDRPIPRYQMIVDPNQFVRNVSAGQHVWVPCEFDVQADGSARLVGGDRSHAHPGLAKDVALPVLEAALPLLAQLKRPQLLLDERRLQVVFKAQRIIVPPKSSENSDAEYIGLWHIDGYHENVVAAALYYYNVDPALQGGDMEFCGREPMDVLGWGDCSNNCSQLSKHSLRKALREVQEDAGGTILQNCRVPIRKGTLLVFSNYQMVHRVLRMVNSSTESEASRDFVALFIIDPAAKPLVPARCHLAQCYMLSRTLKVQRPLTSEVLQTILEFMGELPCEAQRRKKRDLLLSQQLRPQGEFVGNGSVHATGNGCYTMIGWLYHMLDGDAEGNFMCERAQEGWARFRALDIPPQTLDRGLSEVLSIPSEEIEKRRPESIDWPGSGSSSSDEHDAS